MSGDSGIIEGLRETGVHGGIEKIPDPEDVDQSEQQGNIPYPKNEWKNYYKSSNGVASFDVTDRPDVDFRGESVLRADEERGRFRGDKSSWTKQIDLNNVGYETPLYDKLADLSRIWSDRRTEITYSVGGAPDKDKIIFKNEGLKSRGGGVSNQRDLTIGELNDVLEKSQINLNITRPKFESDKRFVEDLKHLRLSGTVLKTDKAKVKFSRESQEKEMEDKNFFNLKINERALEKFTTEADRGDIEDFWGLWTHAGAGEIEWAGFEIGRSRDSTKVREISNFVLIDKNGVKYSIRADLARMVIQNLSGSKKPGTSITTGLEFAVPGGMKEAVFPGKKLEDVAELMKKIKFDGVMLKPGIKFFIGNDFQRA